ncbi:IPT/TIG domain-containing protein [Chitinophaga sp. 22620]|uniref:IPT/TIG domain-containing protein n=1 Tax=Chitinophaga sp. 22620 TaxID=3453952 RepID=UPI003F8686CB
MRIVYTVIAITMLASCKRDKDETPALPVPEITAVSRQSVQSGDTLELTGKNLHLTGLSTEVFISDRPARILSQSENKLQLLVPDKVLTGGIVVHVGPQTALWPKLSVIGSPKIIAVNPRYAFAGDTILLNGENLGNDISALKVWLDGVPAEVTHVQPDAARIVIPAGTDTRTSLSCQTYNGPEQHFDDLTLTVRPTNIVAGNILEYLQKDPGMDLTGALLDHLSLTPANKSLNDTLRQYLTGEKPCIMFLPNNITMNAKGIYQPGDVANAGFMTFNIALNGVLKQTTEPATDRLYPSEYTHYVYEYFDGFPDWHAFVVFREIDGQRYIYSTLNTAADQPIQEFGQPRRIIRKHQCGNSILYEIDDVMNFPIGNW